MTEGYPPAVDLLLGSRLGLWALDQIRSVEVGGVWTDDEAIATAARRREIPVTFGRGEIVRAVGRRALSVHYPHILAGKEIALYDAVYNLHPGLLPFGRGFYPVFWALYAGEPAGATLHRITGHLDGGPIVEQTPVEVLPDDTGGSLHERVSEAERELFTRWWPALTWGELIPATEQTGDGSYHGLRAFEAVRDTPPEADPDAERLIRALTMPGYPLPRWA